MMKFTKMHGCGNDYIYIDGAREHIEMRDKPELVKRFSDRHFGIGGDGVIFINPSEIADFEMEMYNADGSRAEMCGNGIRCVGKYAFDKGLTDKTEISIESCGKIKYLKMTVTDGKVSVVRVDMGKPELRAEEVPVISQHDEVVNEPFEINGKTYNVTCVSMGNPHAVVFMKEINSLDLAQTGPYFECDGRFPKRTNTEFVRIIDRDHIQMRVWERGTGETLACGTGCCASAVASVLNGLTDRKVDVSLLGGNIEIEWDEKSGDVFMTGPAETVFDGEIEIN